MYVARALQLRAGDRARLEAITRATTAPAGVVMRSRIVLMAADGVPNTAIAQRMHVSRPTVLKWRNRYVQAGIGGLADVARPGRRPEIDELEVVAETLADSGKPPADLEVPHWSSRLLATRLEISFATVARIWRKWNIRAHRIGSFRFSTEPELKPTIHDVVGLYLAPPRSAIVLSEGADNQVQALNPGQPDLPLHDQPTPDDLRYANATLVAALELAIGQPAADTPDSRHTLTGFLSFLDLLVWAHPGLTHHVICDDNAVHNYPEVQGWLATHQRITLHVTATSRSWLNLVEIFFGVITRQAVRHGHPVSVADLEQAIRAFLETADERTAPFTWTKPTDEHLPRRHVKGNRTHATQACRNRPSGPDTPNPVQHSG